MARQKTASTSEHPTIKLKDFENGPPVKLSLFEYVGPFQSDFGDSYLMKVIGPAGGKRLLWVNAKSAAGRALKSAIDAGDLADVDLGGRRDFILKPVKMEPNEQGEVFTKIELRWGEKHPPEAREEGYTPAEAIPF